MNMAYTIVLNIKPNAEVFEDGVDFATKIKAKIA